MKRLLLVVAYAAIVVATAMAPGAASAASRPPSHLHKVNVEDTAEAWYAQEPIVGCSLPIIGCLPQSLVDLPPYPNDTLHVSEVIGRETARTYLGLDLITLRGGLHRAVMTLPVDTAATAGTTLPAQARIEVCAATGLITDGTAGSTQPPPRIDCSPHTTARYVAKANAFRVNLTQVLNRAGKRLTGIALLPAANEAPFATWRVAFPDRINPGRHISLTAFVADSLALPHSVHSVHSPVSPASPNSQPAAPPAVTLPGSAASTGAASPVQPPTVAPAQRATADVRPRGFQYPEILLLPLALIVAAIYVARLLTGEAQPLRRSLVTPRGRT